MTAPTLTLSSGRQMPIFGLGTWNSKPGEVAQAVKDAIDAGYRHIDGAHVYQNEAEVGIGVRAKIDEGVVKREDLFIVSKLWNTKHNPSDVEPALRNTLKDLGLDYVDLYLIHWPVAFQPGDELFPKKDDGTFDFADFDYVDTWKAMEELVAKGLTKSIGVSNFNSEQLGRILAGAKIPPAVNQVECHPYHNQAKLFEFCKGKGIILTAYSPFGSPDRPWALPEDPKVLEDLKLVEIGKKYGKTSAQVVLRWMTQRGIIVIPKSVNKSRIAENFAIFDFQLTPEEMEEIASLNRNWRALAVVHFKGSPYFPFNIEF